MKTLISDNDKEISKPAQAGRQCSHENSEKRKVMDFSFWVCLDCGHHRRAAMGISE